jgi:hypothetical protein
MQVEEIDCNDTESRQSSEEERHNGRQLRYIFHVVKS